MGERLPCKQEVSGSTPLSSTTVERLESLWGDCFRFIFVLRHTSCFEKCASPEVLGHLRSHGEFASQKNGSFIRSIRVLISSGFLCISVLMSGVRLSPAAKAGEGEFSPRLPRSQLVRKVACPEIIDSRPVLRSRLTRLVFSGSSADLHRRSPLFSLA